jgi:hypothetical protein
MSSGPSKNESGEVHAFDIHTNRFQILSINDAQQRYTGQQDPVDAPFQGHGKQASRWFVSTSPTR